MRRASFIIIAFFAILLVYPATMPSAKSPGTSADTPTIEIITPNPGGPEVGPDPTGDSGGDDGDGDGLAGIRDGLRDMGGSLVGPTAPVVLKVWWMYVLFHGFM